MSFPGFANKGATCIENWLFNFFFERFERLRMKTSFMQDTFVILKWEFYILNEIKKAKTKYLRLIFGFIATWLV